MALIVMDTPVSGGRADGTPWPPVGEPFEVGDDEANDLIAGGLAHEASDEDRERFEALKPGTVLEESGDAPVHVVMPGGPGENNAIMEVPADQAEDASAAAEDRATAMAAQQTEPSDAANPGLGDPGAGPDGATVGDPSTMQGTGVAGGAGESTTGVAGGAGESTTGVAGGAGESTSAPMPPAASAPKPAWVDYAVSRGADRADADAMTRSELADKYGSSAANG